MIQYFMEVMFFQLLFLLVYDSFLRRETFFQWNRIYLLLSFLISLMLPGWSIELLRENLPATVPLATNAILELQPIVLTPDSSGLTILSFRWDYFIWTVGILISTVWLIYKFYKLLSLRKLGQVQYGNGYTKIMLPGCRLAFSHFNVVFIGEQIPEHRQQLILEHEKVHMRQLHSLDLLLLEVCKVVMWFNPLAYIFQSRLSECHEYLADQAVPIADRQQQYSELLSMAFDTEEISFINHFFKSSLIKKRIVMLQKSPSKQRSKFKYVLALPLLILMLTYASCKEDFALSETMEMQVQNLQELSESEENDLFGKLEELAARTGDWELRVTDGTDVISFTQASGDSYISSPWGKKIRAKMVIEDTFDASVYQSLFKVAGPVPFGEIDRVPVFPGCEEAADLKSCFLSSMMTHIKKNFRYPEAAMEAGQEGQVNILFSITESGEIEDIRVRGPHTILEEEARRIIASLPKMQPGIHSGKEVRVPFSLPITFKLQ